MGKEMMDERIMPEIDQELCILCGDCVHACPREALALVDGAIVLDDERCAYCGDCEDVCPEDAIALPFEVILRADREDKGA